MPPPCPSCSAPIGWAALVLSPAAPLYVRCRSCKARLRLARASDVFRALFVGALVAGAVLVAGAELGWLHSVPSVVATGVVAGVGCALVAGRLVLSGRLVPVGGTPDDGRYRSLAAAGAIAFLGVVVVFALLAAVQARLDLPPPATGGEVGGRLGEAERGWRLLATDGRETTLDVHRRGRPLVLNVWATWCGPCVRELPSLAALREAVGDTVAFAFVSREPPATLASFAEVRGLALPFFSSPERTPPLFDTDVVPVTWILDRRGRVVERVTGAADWSREGIRVRLRALAAAPEDAIEDRPDRQENR